MMRKGLLVFVFLIMLIGCKEKEECVIDNLSKMKVVANNTTIYDSDTLEGPFSLFVYFELTCSDLESGEFELVNSLEQSSTNMRFNKSFIYKGETINAETNIAEFELDGVLWSHHVAPLDSMTIEFQFHNSFFQESTFDSSLYDLTFSITTSDGKNLEKKSSFYFR